MVDEADRKWPAGICRRSLATGQKSRQSSLRRTANDVRLALKLQRGISVELIDALSEHSEHNRKLADDLRNIMARIMSGEWIELVTIVLALAASGGLAIRAGAGSAAD